MCLNQTSLKKHLHYDPDTGVFTRVTRRPGEVAGTLRKDGYIQISVCGELHLAQRLAWLYMTGAWPTGIVDHEDTNRSNNRWLNLREATHMQNLHNAKQSVANTSGVKGVSWDAAVGKWRAQIALKGAKYRLGYFTDIAEAEAAVVAKRAELHGNFANDG